MTRHAIREHVFKILFSTGFHEGTGIREIAEKYLDDSCDEYVSEKERKIIADRSEEIGLKTAELDAELDSIAESWKTKSMGRAELNILRIALYEIRFDPEVPEKVAVNEAVELAKLYCGDNAPSFVNGILKHFLTGVQE